MRRHPGLFVGGQEAADGAGLVEFLRQLLVEVAVLLEDAIHGHVQLLLQVRTVFVDAEIGIRRAHLAHGHHVRLAAVGIQRHQHVDLAPGQHLQQLRRLFRQLDDLGMDVVAPGPVDEHLLLDAVLVHAHPLAVEGGKIVGADLGVVGGDEGVVVLRPHGLGGIQYLLRPLLGIGHVAEQVDLPGDQLLQQLRPAALHVFIGPAGKGRHPLLVHIAVAGAPAELIRAVEGRFVPADANHLFLRHGPVGGEGRGKRQRQHKAQHEQRQSFHGNPLPFPDGDHSDTTAQMQNIRRLRLYYSTIT